MNELIIDWSPDFFENLPDMSKLERENNGIK